MRIAWMGKKTPFCGNVTYSREITNLLTLKGYEIIFLHFSQLVYPELKEINDLFLPCSYKSQIYSIPTINASQILINGLRLIKPQIVHASLTLSPLDFLLPEICKKMNIPLIATFHPPFSIRSVKGIANKQLIMYKLYAPFLSQYDYIVIFSELQRNLLIKLGIPKRKILIIPNGVDSNKYIPSISPVNSRGKTQCTFVYQGRISMEKNLSALLEAWKLSAMGLRAKLVIMGTGPLAKKLISQYNSLEGVLWIGSVVNERRRIEVLRKSNVFILPSFIEGLSLSLLEAMSCGLACLATDAGADADLLDYETGIVLDPYNVTEELKILLPLLNMHNQFRQLLSIKSRKRIEEDYALARNILILDLIYKNINL
uniref:Glycosyltransferase n=1 Tax=Cyanidium sp. THAL103 TaxID=3027999 RepID=A0A9Y1MY06_9RHOD|nr:hypothetical protein CspTHAL103_037 [Cyanidium sp. THAL103]